MITEVAPDILVLQGIDYDAGGATLSALAGRLADSGHPLDFTMSRRPNSGMATPHDLDGDGRLGGPRDAQGYGRFAGAGGMAVLSRWPIGEVTDLSTVLWHDLPGNLALPETPVDQRLSSVAHWIVPIETPSGTLTLLTWRATPPIFDGPEDLNGRRAHDETAIWLRLLDGGLDIAAPDIPYVILGVANVDPFDGEGRRESLSALLNHPGLTPLAPMSDGAAAAPNPGHTGDPALDTAAFGGRAGNLRVSYLLPSSDLAIIDSGVFWPAPGSEAATLIGSVEYWPSHRPVWVDLALTD